MTRPAARSGTTPSMARATGSGRPDVARPRWTPRSYVSCAGAGTGSTRNSRSAIRLRRGAVLRRGHAVTPKSKPARVARPVRIRLTMASARRWSAAAIPSHSQRGVPFGPSVPPPSVASKTCRVRGMMGARPECGPPTAGTARAYRPARRRPLRRCPEHSTTSPHQPEPGRRRGVGALPAVRARGGRGEGEAGRGDRRGPPRGAPQRSYGPDQ